MNTWEINPWEIPNLKNEKEISFKKIMLKINELN